MARIPLKLLATDLWELEGVVGFGDGGDDRRLLTEGNKHVIG